MANTFIIIKDSGEVEAYTSLRSLCDHYPDFKYHTLRWHLANKGWDYQVNGLRILKRTMVGRK